MTTPPNVPDAQISHTDALKYWNTVPATVHGMLGGFPQVSRIDLRGSSIFLTRLRKTAPTSSTKLFKRAVDCGAGIGRVTAGLLSKVAEVVDIVEPVEKFAREAQKNKSEHVEKVYIQGLEDWVPEEKYDLIWNQWCLGHLTDEQVVGYLKRCKEALIEGGWVVVKENMSTGAEGDCFDEEDSTVTRTDEKFRSLFGQSGFKVVRTELQRGFPKVLYPVRFYALQPEVLDGAWKCNSLSDCLKELE